MRPAGPVLLAAALLALPAEADPIALEFSARGGETLAAAPGQVTARATYDASDSPAVIVRMSADLARAFGRMTANNVGNILDIRVCGQVVSSPVVQTPIPGGVAYISGRFTVAETDELARRITTGDCPAP